MSACRVRNGFILFPAERTRPPDLHTLPTPSSRHQQLTIFIPSCALITTFFFPPLFLLLGRLTHFHDDGLSRVIWFLSFCLVGAFRVPRPSSFFKQREQGNDEEREKRQDLWLDAIVLDRTHETDDHWRSTTHTPKRSNE